MSKNNRLIIVSGLSGSGKTVALNTLEDAGFYCIDNLPIALLAELGAHLNRSTVGENNEQGFAVGIDARNHPVDLENFPVLEQQLEKLDLRPELLFLTADNQTLIKRFSETRRRHPLTAPDRPLAAAISRERQLLAPVIEQADLLLDTTFSTMHQLRAMIQQRLVDKSTALSILLQSFGFKNGVPSDADFVFDVRSLPNPHWEPSLRMMSGRDQPVIKYLAGFPQVRSMRESIAGFLNTWIPSFVATNRCYLTIAIGCTGGQHRSVYLADCLARDLAGEKRQVSCRHRELP